MMFGLCIGSILICKLLYFLPKISKLLWAVGADGQRKDGMQVSRGLRFVYDEDLLDNAAAISRRRRPPVGQVRPRQARRADPRPARHEAVISKTEAFQEAGSSLQEAALARTRLPRGVAELLRAGPGDGVARHEGTTVQPRQSRTGRLRFDVLRTRLQYSPVRAYVAMQL